MANPFGKRPLTIVEIDLPYCTRTYGSSPCTAILGGTGRAKCFNSLFTCQDEANYNEGVLTVSFVENIDGIPDLPGVYPCLVSVSSRPGEINLSGMSDNSTALGVRARVTFTLRNSRDNDSYMDKYHAERISGAALASGIGYNPLNRGHYLSRLFARFPYFLGIPVRVKRGYVGDDVALMPTEHYIMTEVVGPNSAGEYTVTAKDVLDLAENEKAVCPAPSSGKLLTDITATATSFVITPEGIGDGEYPASGVLAIGNEIMNFTRIGDTFTVVRGQEGSEAAAHSGLDNVQLCAVFDGETLNQVAEILLTQYAEVPAAVIPSATWQAENDRWYSGFTVKRVIIPKVTGVKKLLEELCNLGVLLFWNPVDQLIEFKVNSPLDIGQTYYSINDDESLLQGTTEISIDQTQRISALWFFHGVRDWFAEMDTSSNFTKLALAPVAKNYYRQPAYKEIYTRWFGRGGDDATVSVIAERLTARFKTPPQVATGQLDVKDRPHIQLGSRILFESYLLENVDGAVMAIPMQVNYVEYTENRVKFSAETFRTEGRFGYWLDEATAPADYTSATPAQREAGMFWGDEAQPGMPDGSPNYKWF